MAHQNDIEAVFAAFRMPPGPYRTFPPEPTPAAPPAAVGVAEDRPAPARQRRRARQDVARPE